MRTQKFLNNSNKGSNEDAETTFTNKFTSTSNKQYLDQSTSNYYGVIASDFVISRKLQFKCKST